MAPFELKVEPRVLDISTSHEKSPLDDEDGLRFRKLDLRSSMQIHPAHLPFNKQDPPAGTQPTSKICSPLALGLFAFGASNLVLSLYTVNARGITQPNFVVGMAFFSGGLMEVLAGMWEFPRGNMLKATALSTFGSFWLSYAVILMPGAGVRAALDNNEHEFQNALGIYLSVWALLVGLFAICTLGTNIALFVTTTIQTGVLCLLAAGTLTNTIAITRAGGIFGIFASLGAFYMAMADVLDAHDNPPFKLPVGIMTKRIAFRSFA